MQESSKENNTLLRPSLVGNSTKLAPYSAQAGFLSAFFGGPLAALAFFAINSHRLDRLARDAVWLGVGVLLLATLEFALYSSAAGPLGLWIDSRSGASAELLKRGLALALFGASAYLHRREQAACDLMGQARPNGTVPAIVVILLGNVLLNVLEKAFQ